jgi:predicted Zn-dependent protease
MPSQQIAITAYVPEELAIRLKEDAVLKRLTVSQYLRRLLERHLKVQPTEMPRQGRPPKEQPAEKTA